MNSTITKFGIAAGMVGVAAVPAAAQSYAAYNPPMMSFSSSGQHDTWNTVLVASAIVGVIGLATNDGTLTIIGAAGVVVSLVETNSSRFRYQALHRGIDLAHAGPLSFGVSPFGGFGSVGVPGMRPAAYAQLSFKL